MESNKSENHYETCLKNQRIRRVCSFERTMDRRNINAYLAIDHFRSGDQWKSPRDALRKIVREHILSGAPQHPIGSRSLYRVWDQLIPALAPTHWMTAGYRENVDRTAKLPLIQIPLSLTTLLTDHPEQICEELGQPVSFAIDELTPPQTLADLTIEDRLTFRFTLLNALTLAGRDRLG